MIFLCIGINLPLFLLHALSLQSRPILVTGEEGFPFQTYFQIGRRMGVSIYCMNQLLVANSVNMYHLRDIIRSSEDWIRQGAFPVFQNLSGQYLDENVSSRVAEYVFFRDQGSILAISRGCRYPIFMVEKNWEDPLSKKGFFQKQLVARASCVLEWEGESIHLHKNILTDKERKALNGSPDSGILYLSRRIVQGMEGISQFSAKGRPGVFR